MLGNTSSISDQTHASRSSTSFNDNDDDQSFRDIQALSPPPAAPALQPPPPSRRPSTSLSIASDVTNSSENFTTMSREFNALVIAGSSLEQQPENNNLDRIGEEEGEREEETNPLAIVADMNPLPDHDHHITYTNTTNSSLGHLMTGSSSSSTGGCGSSELAVHRVKKEEVEAKIAAWQTAKVAKINNRFKREDAIISGWENEQVLKASSWMKKFERKLEEKRAKAMEKMQNDIVKARRKAEERRASAEGKRGTKVAKVLEVANLMKAVGRPPAKRSFF